MRWVACDITTAEGRGKALAACPQPDILVNNAGGPPPGDFRDWDRDAWLRAIDANMLTPIELIKATVDGMIARKFGRIVNITSSAVKAPIDILGYRTERWPGRPSRTRTQGRAACDDQQLPRPVRHRPLRQHGIAPRRVRWRSCARRLTPILRTIGTPAELASPAHFWVAHAGYIVYQNLPDHGGYPGTF